MNRDLQMRGLFVLCVLAFAILILMGWTFVLMAKSAGAEGGRVSGLDAGAFTGLSLMFREVLGVIRSLYDNETRTKLTDQLADSNPRDRPTGVAGDPVHVEDETPERRPKQAPKSGA